jgi:hypothetical protein
MLRTKRRALPKANHLNATSRRAGFLYGVLAGLLLWAGVDAFVLNRWRRALMLPDGAAGDFLALLLIVTWIGLVLFVVQRGVAARSSAVKPGASRDRLRQRTVSRSAERPRKAVDAINRSRR